MRSRLTIDACGGDDSSGIGSGHMRPLPLSSGYGYVNDYSATPDDLTCGSINLLLKRKQEPALPAKADDHPKVLYITL